VTRFQNVPQIARQSVAQINHAWTEKFSQPARLGQARLKFQVFARQRTAEFARHKNASRLLRRNAARLFRAAQTKQRYGNHNALRIRRRLAADNGHAVFLGQCTHAVVNGFDDFTSTWAQRDGQSAAVGGRPSGDVTEGAGQGLWPIFPGGVSCK